jgi:hypothetical protein
MGVYIFGAEHIEQHCSKLTRQIRGLNKFLQNALKRKAVVATLHVWAQGRAVRRTVQARWS